MREIKFRGKIEQGLRRAGEWVYGYYTYDILYPDSEKHHWINGWRVDPETVGQYTGELDNYKVEIYEGDVVRGVHTRLTPYGRCRDREFEGVVEWQQGGFSVRLIDQIIINRFGGGTRIFFSPMSITALQVKSSIHDK